MDLYKDILITLLENEEIHITFPQLQVEMNEIVENRCYTALQKIKAIIEDDTLEDKECFIRIEKIISIFEELGSNIGNRHDFG